MRNFIIIFPAYLFHYVFQVQGNIFRLACTVCGNRAISNYNLQTGLAALTKVLLGKSCNNPTGSSVPCPSRCDWVRIFIISF